jgi:glucose-6-phosphate 1-dehydrogenase
MKALMDEVRFEEGGVVVHMRKEHRPSCSQKVHRRTRRNRSVSGYHPKSISLSKASIGRTVTVQANFSYQASFGSKGPVAYETLLLDSMRGDATLFTRRDEVAAEWRIITPIEEAWAQLPAPDFPNYAAGSEGPTSWQELLEIRGNSAERAIGYGR